MQDPLESLTTMIRKKLTGCYPRLPDASVIRQALEVAYYATLKTEEGRFTHGSLTFADPKNPQPDPPIITRADYPRITPFQQHTRLSVESLVKLARAVDKWSASIAIFGGRSSDLYAWGIVDQLVHHNVLVNREGKHGAANPGVLTITMEGPGILEVYHGALFLGRLQQDRVISYEVDVLNAEIVRRKITAEFSPIAAQIIRAANRKVTRSEVSRLFHQQWANTVARLCIGLRRLGTGGAFLITPRPIRRYLDMTYPLEYRRLRDGIILGMVEREYSNRIRDALRNQQQHVPAAIVRAAHLAEADLDDREMETSGAARVATGLAAVDGVLLLTPLLEILGFGVKIRSAAQVGKVYDGQSLFTPRLSPKLVEISRLGTRHNSVLRYCKADPQAIGIIVSQDGHVRLATMIGHRLVLWSQVRLLGYRVNPKPYVKNERKLRRSRDFRRQDSKLGYGPMPKTFEALMKHGSTTDALLG